MMESRLQGIFIYLNGKFIVMNHETAAVKILYCNKRELVRLVRLPDHGNHGTHCLLAEQLYKSS